MKTSLVFVLTALCASAEVKTMTLRQALDLALAQSPDLMLARLDQQKARAQVTIARDPFLPKVYGGSGVAKTWGFPTSIDGNALSIFEAKTQMAIFDRPQTYQIAQANENLRAAEIDVSRQQDEIVYRVATLFLDAEQAGRSRAAAGREAENLSRVRELVDARVSEGRELPIETKKANLAMLRARQHMDTLTMDLAGAETSLAVVLGMNPSDRVQAAQEERVPLAMPDSEDASIAGSLENSPELKKLESNMQSKMLEIKGYRAMRLPKVNLVAQYSLLGQYNNYLDYFRKFQRNNAELGASFEIPLLVGRAASAYAAQSEADVAKLRIEVSRTRSRISADLRRGFQDVKRADSARELARLDLDVAREQLTLYLAQMDEGRIPMAAVEQARAVEQEKWMVYYEAQHGSETARLSLLKQTGTLVAALK